MGKDQALRGKLAIVTGASKLSGIGAATAVALAEQGANVGAHFLAFHCYRALWPLFFNQMWIHILLFIHSSSFAIGLELSLARLQSIMARMPMPQRRR